MKFLNLDLKYNLKMYNEENMQLDESTERKTVE